MFLTRSPFQTAPATDQPVVVVSHGSPSAPGCQQVAIRVIADALQTLMPNRQVRGATLAAKGALEAAVTGLERPIVCPWFMSDGWFVSTNLPRRLRKAGLATWEMTAPLGLMPGLSTFMLKGLRARIDSEGLDERETVLVIAAHGSPSSARPRKVTEAAARALAAVSGFADIRTCYVDEPPAIRDVAKLDRPGIVLPFFAAYAGHVTGDLPEELEAAGFTGPVMGPVGAWPDTPAVAVSQIAALSTRVEA